MSRGSRAKSTLQRTNGKPGRGVHCCALPERCGSHIPNQNDTAHDVERQHHERPKHCSAKKHGHGMASKVPDAVCQTTKSLEHSPEAAIGARQVSASRLMLLFTCCSVARQEMKHVSVLVLIASQCNACARQLVLQLLVLSWLRRTCRCR